MKCKNEIFVDWAGTGGARRLVLGLGAASCFLLSIILGISYSLYSTSMVELEFQKERTATRRVMTQILELMRANAQKYIVSQDILWKQRFFRNVQAVEQLLASNLGNGALGYQESGMLEKAILQVVELEQKAIQISEREGEGNALTVIHSPKFYVAQTNLNELIALYDESSRGPLVSRYLLSEIIRLQTAVSQLQVPLPETESQISVVEQEFDHDLLDLAITSFCRLFEHSALTDSGEKLKTAHQLLRNFQETITRSEDPPTDSALKDQHLTNEKHLQQAMSEFLLNAELAIRDVESGRSLMFHGTTILSSAGILLIIIGLWVFVRRDRCLERVAKDVHKTRAMDLEFARAMLDASPCLVWLTSESGRIMDANSSFCEFLGVHRLQLIGQHEMDHFSANTCSNLSILRSETLSGSGFSGPKSGESLELTYGSSLNGDLSQWSVKSEDGGVRGVVSSFAKSP